jgi:hypothetical protein
MVSCVIEFGNEISVLGVAVSPFGTVRPGEKAFKSRWDRIKPVGQNVAGIGLGS